MQPLNVIEENDDEEAIDSQRKGYPQESKESSIIELHSEYQNGIMQK